MYFLAKDPLYGRVVLSNLDICARNISIEGIKSISYDKTLPDRDLLRIISLALTFEFIFELEGWEGLLSKIFLLSSHIRILS